MGSARFFTNAFTCNITRETPTGATTTTAYDTVSRVSQVTDRDGRLIQYSYDNANREIGEVWKSAAGATVNLVTYAYDDNDLDRIYASAA